MRRDSWRSVATELQAAERNHFVLLIGVRLVGGVELVPHVAAHVRYG